eukprot:7378174-Prymnesium_polylepis.2
MNRSRAVRNFQNPNATIPWRLKPGRQVEFPVCVLILLLDQSLETQRWQAGREVAPSPRVVQGDEAPFGSDVEWRDSPPALHGLLDPQLFRQDLPSAPVLSDLHVAVHIGHIWWRVCDVYAERAEAHRIPSSRNTVGRYSHQTGQRGVWCRA